MMPTSHVAASHEPEHHQLTAANLKALEPGLTEQHEVLGRFVGGSNSLIARAELQALFRANGVLGDAGAQDQLVAGYLQQQLPADLAGVVGAATSFGQSEYAVQNMGGLSGELDYPGPFPETHWHSQATTAESWGHNLMSPTGDEALGDPSVGNSYGMPPSPTKKAYSDLGDSGYQSRPRCGRASSEYQRASMVGQLPTIHPQLQAGMVGGYPLGHIGQIPEGSAAQMGSAGQFVRTAPQFSGPVQRMIGPFPAQVTTTGSMMYSAPMQQPGADGASHMVGQYPSIGALPGAYGTGTYPVTQTDDRLRRFSAPVGQAQQLQDARQLLAMRNSGNVGAAHVAAGTLPAIGATERRRPIIGEVPSYTQASSMAGDSSQGASLGMSQVEVLQQYYAAHAAQQQHHQQMASVRFLEKHVILSTRMTRCLDPYPCLFEARMAHAISMAAM
ncbi:hypothetical protein COCOBI_15-2490 [Coccomyxa sp. Obi]|nr:hypothetical protein COCOBI_15-2490 [Coccomyxa sp. Obi]